MDDSQLQSALAAFADAICIAGGQTAIAKICDCTPGNISQLVLKRRPLSARFAMKVEAATGVHRSLLRPDIYPVEAPASPVDPVSHPAGAPIPEGRNSSFPAPGSSDANLDPVEASQTVAGGKVARSSNDPDRATDPTPPTIGKAAA